MIITTNYGSTDAATPLLDEESGYQKLKQEADCVSKLCLTTLKECASILEMKKFEGITGKISQEDNDNEVFLNEAATAVKKQSHSIIYLTQKLGSNLCSSSEFSTQLGSIKEVVTDLSQKITACKPAPAKRLETATNVVKVTLNKFMPWL